MRLSRSTPEKDRRCSPVRSLTQLATFQLIPESVLINVCLVLRYQYWTYVDQVTVSAPPKWPRGSPEGAGYGSAQVFARTRLGVNRRVVRRAAVRHPPIRTTKSPVVAEPRYVIATRPGPMMVPTERIKALSAL